MGRGELPINGLLLLSQVGQNHRPTEWAPLELEGAEATALTPSALQVRIPRPRATREWAGAHTQS